MTPEIFYDTLLGGVAGNAASDGLKGYLNAWKTIILPKAKSPQEVMDKLELLIEANVQTIENQTFMLEVLKTLHQQVVSKTVSDDTHTFNIKNVGQIVTGNNANFSGLTQNFY